MAFPFAHEQAVHGIPDGTHAFLVQEVAHVDAESVDHLAPEVGILHHVAEETCSRFRDGETDVVVLFACGVVILFEDVMACCVVIESQGIVYVFDNPAPTAVLCSWTPHDVVVARKV